MRQSRPPLVRMQYIDRQLRDNTYPNCTGIARHFEVSTKSIQRDVDYMRDLLHAPIHFDSKKNGYYYSKREWVFLPSTTFDRQEVDALIVTRKVLSQYQGTPYYQEVSRALDKVLQYLPGALLPSQLSEIYSFEPFTSTAIDPHFFALIEDAIRNKVDLFLLALADGGFQVGELAKQYILGLSAEPGVFPNFSFVRALKRELEGDRGTIFRYSNHENSVLLAIYRQLAAAGDPSKDRDELLRFIVSITNANGKKELSWKSPRNMVDLWYLVKRYYYDPYTKGSNSIKYILPAVLNSSDFLKKKYGKPIYGAPSGIPSLNFTEWQWLQCDELGMVKDPYALLPKLFTDIDEKNSALLLSSDDDNVIKHGGAAMTAFARLQFEEMTEYEREAIKGGLKKYCELDTMAMVMIYEAWVDWLQ